MAELIYEFTASVTARVGVIYRSLVVGERQPDGMWHGWIEFQAVDGSPGLATEREISHPSRSSLMEWAVHLNLPYYETALGRAQTIARRPHAAAVV